MQSQKLIEIAKEARKFSYAPYSHFCVGCAVELADGSVVKGCNIENIAFSSTICAERTAIIKAISEGKKDIIKIAIIADETEVCYPCGECRQVIMQLAPNATIICAKNENEFEEYNISQLLPKSFVASQIGEQK